MVGVKGKLIFDALVEQGYVLRGMDEFGIPDNDELTDSGKRLGWLREYHPDRPLWNALGKDSYITMDVTSEGFKAFVEEIRAASEKVLVTA